MSCDFCAKMQLRYEVAVRTACQLNYYIHDVGLISRVIEDIAIRWALNSREARQSTGFDQFFTDYCTDVERDVEPELRRGSGQPWEFRRVWTNHAAVLAGELDRICQRGEYELVDGA